MRFGSVCSGIEAASVAWEPLGWTPVFFSEIDKFPSAVLAHRWAEVPNLGDMTKFKEWPDAAINVLVGGTPCQSFSVAGLRKGLDDPRGNLMLTFGAVAAKYRPQWVVWENVPGVLSSNNGRDFGAFLGMLGQLGYGFAYRVLDAQFFGVAQRRRRVFVVGCLGNWRAAAAVLFERHSLSGDIAPSREARQEIAHDVAPSLVSSGRGVERIGETRGQNPVVACLDASYARLQGCSGQDANHGRSHLVPTAFPANLSGTQCAAAENLAPSLVAQNPTAVALMDVNLIGALTAGFGKLGAPEVDAYTAIPQESGVRRLTPTECERLQGFPDEYTQVPHRGKPAADGPRYKALGNSMAVPVMNWIGRRIDEVDQIINSEAA